MRVRKTNKSRWLMGLLAAILAASGCGTSFETVYGKRRGRGAQSVAGTAVFAEMVKASSKRPVSSWSRISPRLDDFDVIFWFPDDFNPPSMQHRAALEEWIANGEGRKLVYVGRDFDALTAYWDTVVPLAPAEQWEEVANRRAAARTRYETRRVDSISKREYTRWFVQQSGSLRDVDTLQSDVGLADGVDPSKLNIRIGTRLEKPKRADVPKRNGSGAITLEDELDMQDSEAWERKRYYEELETQVPEGDVVLDTNAGPLVRQLTDYHWGDGEIIVVTNGSFLLNLALVKQEHRQLAQNLIDYCEVDGRQVVFLESKEGGPPIFRNEPEDAPAGLEMFTTWPLGFVMFHLLGLGVIACFALYPQFGRPRELDPPDTSDFGHHIAAVGELMSSVESKTYLTNQLRNYHLQVKRESGISHTAGDADQVVAADTVPMADASLFKHNEPPAKQPKL